MADSGLREFTTDLSLYEKGRPDYSKESVEFLLSRVGALPSDSKEATKLLEIAAGTGKFTRAMAEVLRAKKANVEVIASDSQEKMCEMFRCLVPGIEVLHFPAENIADNLHDWSSGGALYVSTLEETNRVISEFEKATISKFIVRRVDKGFGAKAFPDESISIIICAQSFHWFSSDKSVAEICRVLKPGGKYGMIWNHRDWSVPWVRAMQDVVDPFVRQNDMPADPRELKWMESLDNSGKFTPVERNASLRTYLDGDIDKIVSVIMCISAISQSSEEKRVKVEAKIRDILTNHPDLQGTKEYRLPYVTDICWCTKK